MQPSSIKHERGGRAQVQPKEMSNVSITQRAFFFLPFSARSFRIVCVYVCTDLAAVAVVFISIELLLLPDSHRLSASDLLRDSVGIDGGNSMFWLLCSFDRKRSVYYELGGSL